MAEGFHTNEALVFPQAESHTSWVWRNRGQEVVLPVCNVHISKRILDHSFGGVCNQLSPAPLVRPGPVAWTNQTHPQEAWADGLSNSTLFV